MQLAMIGIGYVGLTTGTGFAEMGNQVVCVDIDKQKVDKLNDGEIPIYEPGLEELVKRNYKEKRLVFTTDLSIAVSQSDLIFIAVGTPPGEDGSADLQYVLDVARNIAQSMEAYKVVILKSTVPVGTGKKIKEAMSRVLRDRDVQIDFDLVSNPEFLKEGAAIDDFMKPDRIIVGLESDRAKKMMEKLYTPFVRNLHRIIFMDIPSSEMTKYAANAMLATRISFMNEISRLCEKVGADIEQIRHGIGSDKRIGTHFIYPGLGYGGSCFPKDVQALLMTGRSFGEPMDILDAVEKVNQNQRKHFIDEVTAYFSGQVKGLRFAIWGLAFKSGTDDMREAPSIDVIEALLSGGAEVIAYDPVAISEAKKVFGDRSGLTYIDNQYEALEQVDALCIVTDWRSFREPDFARMKSLMRQAIVFDGRNQFNPVLMKDMGFYYYSIGRKF